MLRIIAHLDIEGFITAAANHLIDSIVALASLIDRPSGQTQRKDRG